MSKSPELKVRLLMLLMVPIGPDYALQETRVIPGKAQQSLTPALQALMSKSPELKASSWCCLHCHDAMFKPCSSRCMTGLYSPSSEPCMRCCPSLQS